MHIITLPKEAIYTLHTLSKTLTQLTGYRCKLSRYKELIHILKLSSLARHPRIQSLYLRFLSQLDIEQLQHLFKAGVQIPSKMLPVVELTTWQNALNIAHEKVKVTYSKALKLFTGNLSLAN